MDFNFFIAHPSYYLFLIGLLGLCVGSFLNVVAYRLPRLLQYQWRAQCLEFLNLPQDSSLIQQPFNLFVPRSHCPHCQQPLRIRDNIPIVSYLFLKGHCAHCSSKISVRYLLTELVCSILSVMVAWRYGVTLAALFGLIFSWLLLCLSLIDIEHKLLPDDITYSLLWLGLLLSLLPVFASSQQAILGAGIGYMSLWAVTKLFYWVTKKVGMGHGDFKLLAALGAWLGWQALPIIILISSFSGAVIGLFLIAANKKYHRDTPIPFGPFLAFTGWLIFISKGAWADYLGYLN